MRELFAGGAPLRIDASVWTLVVHECEFGEDAMSTVDALLRSCRPGARGRARVTAGPELIARALRLLWAMARTADSGTDSYEVWSRTSGGALGRSAGEWIGEVCEEAFRAFVDPSAGSGRARQPSGKTSTGLSSLLMARRLGLTDGDLRALTVPALVRVAELATSSRPSPRKGASALMTPEQMEGLVGG